jgi:hypothetical protein
MTIRVGVTQQEEKAMQKIIAEGGSWADCMAVLNDVDYEYVKAKLFDPMKAAFDAAQLQKDIGGEKK